MTTNNEPKPLIVLIVDWIKRHDAEVEDQNRRLETGYSVPTIQKVLPEAKSRQSTSWAFKLQKKKLINKKITFVIIGLTIGLIITGVLWQPVGNYITLHSANPKMIQLARDSGMSRKGELLFLKAKPQLDSDAAMETDCSSNAAANNSNGFIEQGCYDPQTNRIYIRKMPQNLYDLEVSTAAYEMLHIAYIQLANSAQKEALNRAIESNYQIANDSNLRQQVANFAKTEPGDKDLELFSLLATDQNITLTSDLTSFIDPYLSDATAAQNANANVHQLFVNDQDQLTSLQQLYNTYLSDSNSAINNANTAYYDSTTWAAAGNQYEDDYNYNIYVQDYNAYSQDIDNANSIVDQYNSVLDDYNNLVSEYNGQQPLGLQLVQAQSQQTQSN